MALKELVIIVERREIKLINVQNSRKMVVMAAKKAARKNSLEPAITTEKLDIRPRIVSKKKRMHIKDQQIGNV